MRKWQWFCDNKCKWKKDRSALAKELCNRYEGIGADGFIVILPHKKYDFEWEFYNNDGSTASMCGNGSRAAAHFAHHINGIKPHMAFLTGAGVIKANVDNNSVEVSLGKIKNIQDAFSECEKLATLRYGSSTFGAFLWKIWMSLILSFANKWEKNIIPM